MLAIIRNKSEKEIYELLETYTEKPLLGIFGPEKINVMKIKLGLGIVMPFLLVSCLS